MFGYIIICIIYTVIYIHIFEHIIITILTMFFLIKYVKL